MKRTIIIITLMLAGACIFASDSENIPLSATKPASDSGKWWPELSFGFNAGLCSEEEFANRTTLFAFYDNSLDSSEVPQGYFIGMTLFYRPEAFFDIFADASYHKTEYMVGSSGSSLRGSWVFNESGGSSVSPVLTNDVYYTCKTSYARLGVRGIYSINRNFELWLGAAAGAAVWSAAFSDEGQSHFYSSLVTGVDFGLSCLAGVDINFFDEKDSFFTRLSLYFDGARIIPSDGMSFENVIWNGWELTSTQAPVILPMRIGLALFFKL